MKRAAWGPARLFFGPRAHVLPGVPPPAHAPPEPDLGALAANIFVHFGMLAGFRIRGGAVIPQDLTQLVEHVRRVRGDVRDPAFHGAFQWAEELGDFVAGAYYYSQAAQHFVDWGDGLLENGTLL